MCEKKRECVRDYAAACASWEAASVIIERYQIRYIVVGSIEQSKYGVRLDEEKFISRLHLVYDSPEARIYEDPASLE